MSSRNGGRMRTRVVGGAVALLVVLAACAIPEEPDLPSLAEVAIRR